MQQDRIEKFKIWFEDYVAGFYGDDKCVNANLKLKVEHSLRTCKEMVYLADELGLDDEQRRIAEVIALFHDIGRFEQFVKCRTFNDARSVDHCLLGLEVLQKTKVLEPVEAKERQLIEKAIEYHGRIELPSDLEPESLLFAKLIRDADKVDALRVVTEYYKEYRDNPEEFMLELEFPDEPGYSAEVVEGILRGRRIDYSKLRTWNDMKLCQLGWMYDVNFAATLKRIKKRGFLETIFEFLPDTRDMKKVREKIFGYVDSRIEQEEAQGQR
jgi:putative nucleotidyltransferase with HDIG domain